MAYNDSRQTAIRLYRKLRLGWLFNTSSFLGNLIMAFIAVYFFQRLGHPNDMNYVFFLSVLAIGLWVTEGIPPFAVGIFLIASLLFGFGTDFILPDYRTPVEIYLDTWTSNVIWLLLGGFFLAEGMARVGLDRDLFNFTLKRFGKNPKHLLLGLMITTALGSMVMSNTATTAMMISSVLPLVRALKKNTLMAKSLLVGIPAAATLGGMGTIIGSTPNAIAVGALQDNGVDLTFVDWMIFGFPLALLCTWLFWKLLTRGKGFAQIQLPLEELQTIQRKVKPSEKRSVIFTLILTISLWLTEPFHGIPVAATSAVPIVLLTLFQVIGSEDVRRLPWDTLMLVAGGLALGLAMVQVGLSDAIMTSIDTLQLSLPLVALLFALFGVLVSNVMSNTAASSILVPLGLTLPGIWSIVVPLVVALSCSCALLLPVSTPSNAIAFSTGLVEQKEFRRGGIWMIGIGPLLSFVVILIYSWLIYG